MRGYNHVTLVGIVTEKSGLYENNKNQEIWFNLAIKSNVNKEINILKIYSEKKVAEIVDYHVEIGSKVLVDGYIKNNNGLKIIGNSITLLNNKGEK